MHTPPLHVSSPARSSVRRFNFLLFFLFALPAALFAQATGTITGRVFKPGTGEYVRNAEVRIAGTDRVVESESEGVYRFTNVPAGPVTITVAFTGYTTASAPVTVISGQTVTQDFDLRPENQVDGETIELAAFVVISEVEGQAKSIQNQKRSINIGDHVSSDAFGDVVEGNVGEFLKQLPGVDLEYVQFDARGPRLRGMDPQYVGVTMDGVKLASADAFNATVGTDNAGIDGSRAFGFESISLSSIDSVEVFKNLSADLDADAPAGTINLRSKRAFERKGRRISYSTSVSANSEEFHLNKTAGPGDHKTYKTRPSASIEYSDTFMNNRLGVVFNYSYSSIYNEFQQYAMSTVNRRVTHPTTGVPLADQRPAVPRMITFTDGPKITDRATGSFRFDFKATPTFSFGVNTTIADYHAYNDNRQFRFISSADDTSASGRSTVIGDNPMVSFTTGAAGASSITLLGDGFDKFTDTISVMPSFDWRPTNNLLIEGRFGWSESENEYKGISEGKARAANADLINVKYSATRSSIDSADWKFTQISGADWGDVASYKNPRIGDEGRTDRNEVYSGAIDATWKHLSWKLPTFFKAGIKSREEYRQYQDFRAWNVWQYIGPGGGTTGSWAPIPTGDPIDMSSMGIDFGRPPGYAGRSYAADLFNNHPEYFVQTGNTAANYYSSFIGNDKDIYERVDAAYFLANTRYKKLQLQAGLRYEKTTDEMKQWQQRPRSQVLAAGYTVDGTGRANTISGLQYQFQSQPKGLKETDYDNLFASAAIKYSITSDLDLQFGMHQAINRPPLNIIAGVTTYNDQTSIITAPNPGLLPEESINYSAKLIQYLPAAGKVAIGVFQTEIDNLRENYDRLPGTWSDEFPEIDPIQYGNYTVRSTVNGTESRQFRGMEVEYEQLLSFLPHSLRGTKVFVNYTRNYADVRRGGMAPHQINTGGTIRFKRLTFGGSAIWTSDTPWTNTAGSLRYRKERIRTDLNASLWINKWVTLVLSGRDVGNIGQELIEKREGSPDELVQKDIYGALWTLSVKGTF